jgi:signal transduction histidine kinase
MRPAAIDSQGGLVAALGDILDPTRRAGSLRTACSLLGVEEIILFVEDAEVEKLLAAPGFPQTLPDRVGWGEFVAASRRARYLRGSLPWPDARSLLPAVGAAVSSGAVVVTLGGFPAEEQMTELVGILRLVVPGFVTERSVTSMAVQLQLARQVTEEAATLAASLDDARRAAQEEIAARKDVEAALREARDQLARSNLELEQHVRERTEKLRETIAELEAFSYSVSHDLRAPLRAMYGYAEILLKDAGEKLTKDERHYLERIKRAGQRMDRLVQDVLRYSRVSRTEVSLQTVDLERVLREVIEEHPMLRSYAQQITVVPPLGKVLGHDMLLTQCFSNLLLNAIKFVAPGVQPEVRVWSEGRDAVVRVWIEDNGIGIASHHLPKLFGMFERIHPADAFEGNGIGLAIVKRSATRMGGEVGVESIPGAGSRFWVDLQRAAE